MTRAERIDCIAEVAGLEILAAHQAMAALPGMGTAA